MAHQPLAVNLQSSLTICQTIEGLLQDSLGPNALHTMLTSSSGNVVITGDGFTLLTSLHLSHPVARWIVGRVKGHHGCTGDGCKSFILIVTEILRQLQDAISSSNTNSAASVQKQDMIQIGQALEQIQSKLFPEFVLPKLMDHCMHLSLTHADRDDVVCTCKKIVWTALSGKFSKHSTDHIAELTVDLVCNRCDDVSNLGDVIEELISDYDVVCMEVSNQPVSKSKLLEGAVLTRRFVIQSDDLDHLTSVPFMILGCSLDEWTPDVQSTLVVGNNNVLMDAFQFRTSQVRTLIDHLERCDIKLILSSEPLSDVTLSFCRAAGISAVHMIPEEELNRLARLTKTDIIYDPSDLLVSDLKIGTAKFCRSVTVGNKTGIHLGLSDRTSVQQLIICAPTQGICRQWFMAVFNTLKTLRMWLDTSWLTGVRDTDNTHNNPSSKQTAKGCEHEESERLSSSLRPQTTVKPVRSQCASGLESPPSVKGNGMPSQEVKQACCIPGAGCTELLLHKIFKSLASNTPTEGSSKSIDPSLITACQILSQAALCIPKTIHRNSFRTKCQGSSFLEMVSKVKVNSCPVGIDGKTGALCSPLESVLEPLSGRVKLWHDAIQTIQDLLKMDMIVSVKALPSRDGSTSLRYDSMDDDCSDE